MSKYYQKGVEIDVSPKTRRNWKDIPVINMWFLLVPRFLEIILESISVGVIHSYLVLYPLVDGGGGGIIPHSLWSTAVP